MRISTTTLESFRLFRESDQEWMSEADLLATIRGEFTPTPAMLLGRAFDQVLERPDRYRVDGGYQCDTYFFADEAMRPALAVFDRRGVFQAKATKRYGDCEVVAKADQLLGGQLIENKTTTSSFSFEKYADSYQWRFMVDLFEPALVTYHVFCLSEDRDGTIGLRGIETFNLYPYPGVHADCVELVQHFREYVIAKGLDGLLRERQHAAMEGA